MNEDMEDIQSADMAEDNKDAQFEQPDRATLMFDPYLASSHSLVNALTENLTFSFEHILRGGVRKMKARDKENLHAMLGAVFANLALSSMIGETPPHVAVSLRASNRKTTRYDRIGFGGLADLLRKLDGAELGLRLVRSSAKGTASLLMANDSLEATLSRVKFDPDQFRIVEGQETIWLSKVTKRDPVNGHHEYELIDYRDTPDTVRYRAEMVTINQALKVADLRFVQSGDEGWPALPTFKRGLRRVFNLPDDAPEGAERFDLGGRLFGGWWQTLKSDRRRRIRINGEPMADLDFSSMFLRLAYLHAGHEPPSGDLYAAIPRLSERQWRPGVKTVILAMLSRKGPLTRLPKDCAGQLPNGETGASVRKAILAAHPALESVFEQGIGLHLMFQESQILVAALLDLAAQNIPALPMHDGLMCQKSKAGLVREAMGRASERLVGIRLPISLK